MPLVRRFVLLAVLTLSGGFAFTGCQSAPGLAAEVGDIRLTDAQVEDIVKQYDEGLAAKDQERIDQEQSGQPLPSGSPEPAPQGLPEEVFGDVRRAVVEWTVFNEIARQYVAEKGLSLPPPDYKGAAQQLRLKDGAEDNALARLLADMLAYRQLLESNVQRAEPTEADLLEAYRRAIAAGAVGVEITYEQVRPELAALDQIKTGVWLRNELATVAERIGVLVSPRYQPIEVATGSLTSQSGQLVLVALPLGESAGSPAVRDAS